MRRLAFVITQSELGGAQKNVLLLASRMKENYDITVYAAPGGLMIEELSKLGIRFVPVENMTREINPREDYRCYKFLKEEFLKNSYNIVHCHSSKAGIIARAAATNAKIENIIYTAHGFVFNEPMNPVKKNIYKFLEKYLSKFCDYIICVSEKDMTIARKYNFTPKKDIAYIPNGIDFEIDDLKKEEIRNDLNLSSEDFVFGFVANFYETKGHRYLIEGFNNLIRRGLKAKLLLIGDGALIKEMKELSSGNDNIHFLGFKNEASKLIKAFDCFILSSVKEGFPFVILESVKCKVPIISTNVGAMKNIISHKTNGILIAPGDINAITDSMIFAMENREKMTQMAENLYNLCSEKYSINKMIEMTRKVYESR